MQTNFITLRRLFFGLAAVAVVGILIAQRSTLSRLRRQPSQLTPESSEAKPALRSQRAMGISEVEFQEMERLRRDNEDLHKLRNEVAQLRKQKVELESARGENQRLRLAKASREQLDHLSGLPGYVPNGAWADAGFSSPEATVRTFFWALREGKFERMLDCMAPAVREQAGGGLTQPTEKERQEVGGAMRQVPGYRIAEKKALTEDEVILELQAPLFGDRTVKMPMKRFGAEWKLTQEPR
ncbi:MAG: hypothetical protein HY735_01530 [Verrucomicrobia bacterium]|nr:hypothetical protein [Verrucomicrobiota bacterium]